MDAEDPSPLCPPAPEPPIIDLRAQLQLITETANATDRECVEAQYCKIADIISLMETQVKPQNERISRLQERT